MGFPIPTAREVRWGFYLVGLCALAITATICWGVVHKVNQSDEIVRVAASSSAQVDRLSEQIDALQADATTAQQESAGRQEALRKQNRQLRRQLDAVVEYLREHGLTAPSVAVTPRGHTRPKGPAAISAPSSPHHSPSPAPASPGSTGTTPTPSAGPTPVTAALCDLLNISPCPLP